MDFSETYRNWSANNLGVTEMASNGFAIATEKEQYKKGI